MALALSGGVDSSALAAECAAQGTPPEAFTVVFDGDSRDLAYARQVSRHLHLEHRVIDVPGFDAARQLDRAVRHYDEPFADSSALPSLALAEAVGGRYKVILNGDGGDEAFGGYPHYRHIRPKQWIKAAAATAGACDGAGSAAGVYVQSKAIFRRRERARLLGDRVSGDALAALLRRDGFLTHVPGGALHRALWCDRHLYLPNDLTYKTDIAFAAFGMESRAPFLDHRLLEWAQGLPARQLVRCRQQKVLLREAYADRLPAGLLDRAKQGFGAPIGRWLDGPLREAVRESLPCPLLDRHAQREPARRASSQRLWTLLVFARWASRWRAQW